MKHSSSYVMRDQVRGLVPSLMRYDVTREYRDRESRMHYLAVAAVTFVYLFAMTLSG